MNSRSDRCLGTAAALVFLVLCLAGRVSSQSTFGSITGSVIDPTGARVPGARITVTNEDTGVKRTMTAGADGVYAITDLLPGRYGVQSRQMDLARSNGAASSSTPTG
jgi:Protocatechuate 3,4-dioxygenase beta subunit